MGLGAKRSLFLSPSVIAALIFFAVLWYADFPKPFYDDLFYFGPGLNLARGGDLSNPLLIRQGFPSHYFFVYPPLHAYAIAGWLKVFGISALSVTAFSIVMYAITCVSAIAILRRHAAPAWLEWAVPLGVTVSLLPAGLRTEPFAIALTMAGFAMLEWKQRLIPVFFGFLLVFLGASASPRNTPFAAALAILALFSLWKSSGRKRIYFVIAAAALAAAFFIFLLLIGFRLTEFLKVFRFHMARVEGHKLSMLLSFIKSQRLTVYPVWAAFFGLLGLYLLRRPGQHIGCVGIVAVGVLALEAIIGNLIIHVLWYMVLALFCFAAVTLKNFSRWQSISSAACLFLILGLANCKVLLMVLGIATGQIDTDRGPEYQRAIALRPTADHPLLVDFSAARYVFNYDIPEGSIDLAFAAAFPGTFVTCDDLHAGDVYLTCISSRRGLVRDTYLQPLPKNIWDPVHLDLLSFDRHPRQCYIISAEECKAVRPEVPKVKDPTGMN